MLALMRLLAQKEARLSRLPTVERELRLSLPGLAAWCRLKALEIREEERPEETDSLELDCDLSDFRLKAIFSREEGRLNLNEAEREELLALFEDLGLSPARAEIMADSLLDWRDQDHEHRAEGAEKDFYRTYEPRNGPLTRLDEVVLVRGFDPYLFWLEPGLYQEVTIYAPKRGDRTEGPLSLKEPGVYREELVISYRGFSWRYLEIFSQEGPGTFQVLYRRLLPIR